MVSFSEEKNDKIKSSENKSKSLLSTGASAVCCGLVARLVPAFFITVEYGTNSLTKGSYVLEVIRNPKTSHNLVAN